MKTTPAMVVPVFHALGTGIPFSSIMALRFTRLKSKPPALVPILAALRDQRWGGAGSAAQDLETLVLGACTWAPKVLVR